MKRILYTLLALVTPLITIAQSQTFRNVTVQDTLKVDSVYITTTDTSLNSWESFRGYYNDTLLFRADPSFSTVTYSGYGNTSWGFGNLMKLSTGYHNSAFASNCLQNLTTGYQNTGTGNRCFYNLTTGFENTGNGQGAGFTLTTGSQNSFYGFHAALNLNPDNSTFIGFSCGQGTASGTATNNTGGGRNSFLVIRNGNQNAGWGRASFTALLDGSYNWGGGDNVGLSLTNGNYDSYTGYLSGYGFVGANASTTASYQSFYGAYTSQGVAAQLNYAGTFGYGSTVSMPNIVTFNGTNLAGVGIGNDSANFMIDVQGTGRISNTPQSTNTNDSVLVKDATTGQVKAIAQPLSGSATLDFPSTGANGQSDLTITVTGAIEGDVVAIGIPNAATTQGTFVGWVSAANTVTIRFHNTSGGNIDPASGTFKVKVLR
jgi:hypothetical protein